MADSGTELNILKAEDKAIKAYRLDPGKLVGESQQLRGAPGTIKLADKSSTASPERAAGASAGRALVDDSGNNAKPDSKVKGSTPLDLEKIFGMKKSRPAAGKPGSIEWLEQHPDVFGAELPAPACQAQPIYDRFIDRAIRTYYRPSRFGNIAELKQKGCGLGDPKAPDAIDKQLNLAHEMLKRLDDPFTDVMMPAEVRAFELRNQGLASASKSKR